MQVGNEPLYEEFTKRKDGEDLGIVKEYGNPLQVMLVNDSFKVAVFKGKISPQDILIKYKQNLGGEKWSNIRTPKHIHWAVDLIIKMHIEPHKTKEFLEFLLNMWRDTKRLESEEALKALSLENLLKQYSEQSKHFKELSGKGEYSIGFLILLAKLLMIQEKTNREDAYMFGNVLSALKSGKDIYKIVATATFRGR